MVLEMLEKYKEDKALYKARGGKQARTYPFHYALRCRQKFRGGVLRLFWAAIYRLTLAGSGCYIATRNIGRRLYVPHISGIIISLYASIGDDCTIYQQVTIGQEDINHKGQAPHIGNSVYIGAGAKIIGPVHVGNNVKIGANAVVTKDIPDNCTVIGANRIIKRQETK